MILKEQSYLGLHCLTFHLHVLDMLPYGMTSLYEFKSD